MQVVQSVVFKACRQWNFAGALHGCRAQPGFITHRLNTDAGLQTGQDFGPAELDIPAPPGPDDFEYAFRLKDITASYSGRDVLHGVSWSVLRDQKWSLTGHNGAGKSTLLSFLYADNPQVYCNDVRLFDRQRGTGESIWEVKDRIGFYSTEMYRYFNKVQTFESAINSVVYQNPYDKRVLNSGEELFARQLLRYFQLDILAGKMLCDLSAVTQKLVILSAILIKNPPLLILDEPFQGFSESLVRKCLALLEKFIRGRTFIMVSHNSTDFPAGIDRHFHLTGGRGQEISRGSYASLNK